jgi:hypothetical protein
MKYNGKALPTDILCVVKFLVRFDMHDFQIVERVGSALAFRLSVVDIPAVLGTHLSIGAFFHEPALTIFGLGRVPVGLFPKLICFFMINHDIFPPTINLPFNIHERVHRPPRNPGRFRATGAPETRAVRGRDMGNLGKKTERLKKSKIRMKKY